MPKFTGYPSRNVKSPIFSSRSGTGDLMSSWFEWAHKAVDLVPVIVKNNGRRMAIANDTLLNNGDMKSLDDWFLLNNFFYIICLQNNAKAGHGMWVRTYNLAFCTAVIILWFVLANFWIYTYYAINCLITNLFPVKGMVFTILHIWIYYYSSYIYSLYKLKIHNYHKSHSHTGILH